MDDLTIEQVRDMIADAGGAPAEGTGSENGAAAAAFAEDAPVASDDAVPDELYDPEAVAPDEAEARAYIEGGVGLGVDIVEIARMAAILERTPSFSERVFSPEERAYCDKMSNSAAHYALRFAAKEAVVKALGTGFTEGIGVRDIEVQRAQNGKPGVLLTGRALEIAEEQGVKDLSISLSYTHTDAVACAMAITEASVRATEKRKDPMEELARQFKEVRGMLDEL